MEIATELGSLGVKIDDGHIVHRTKRYRLDEVARVGYLAVQTSHFSNGSIDGVSSEAKCRLYFSGGDQLNFRAKSGISLAKNNHVIAPVWLLHEVVSDLTFEARLQRYERELSDRKFFEVAGYQFDADGNVFRRAKRIARLMGDKSKVFLQPFSIQIADGGRSATIPIDIDKDCILYILRDRFSLYWEDAPYRQVRSVQQRVFFRAIVRLGAKVAKSDGVVSPEEIRHFKDYFGSDEFPMDDVAAVFREAVSDGISIFEAARELAQVASGPEVLESVLIGLVGIASVDGEIHPGERAGLLQVGRAFGLDAAQVDRLLDAHGPKTQQSSNDRNRKKSKPRTPSAECLAHLKVLGLNGEATSPEIKEAYRSLATSLHPDLLRSKGLPEKLVQIANETLAGVNVSYRWLKQNGYV